MLSSMMTSSKAAAVSYSPISTGTSGLRRKKTLDLNRNRSDRVDYTKFSKKNAVSCKMVGPKRIERLIQEEGIVMLPGVYDALSAQMVERSGYSAGFVSGFAVSASHLGKPDFGLLMPPEMANVARLICNATQIPFIVDADTGGGGPLNVQRTIKDLISAGAAGCFLEDQAWPKKCGHIRGKQVIPAEEHAVKIAAAKDAIGDADFFLLARTDARSVNGLSDAIARANLYMDAGADGCFVEAPRDEYELREIARRTPGFKACNLIEGGVTPLRKPEELRDLGFHIIIYSLTTLLASARGTMSVLKALKDKGTVKGDLDKIYSFEEFNQLIDMESWFDTESQYSKLKFETKTEVDSTIEDGVPLKV